MGNTVEFGAVWLAQTDIVVFSPHWSAFRGLAIVDNFNAHMELLHKSWVLNNPMPDHLRMSSFPHLGLISLYAICLHLKSGWPREYFGRHGDGLVDSVGI